MALTGVQYHIAAGEHEATIVEVGAGLRRYAHAGVDDTFGFGEDVLPPMCCGATLVPWPNRLRGGHYVFDGERLQLALTEPATGNAIHGLGRWARWTPLQHEASVVRLGLDIVPQQGWPFEVRVEVAYALHPEHGLAVTASAYNTGTRRAPFGAGFHPYLSTRGTPISRTNLRLPADRRLVLDEVQVPVGMQSVRGSEYDLRRGRQLRQLRMDTGFTGLRTENGRGAAELRTRAGGAQLWFDETFRYLQVFTRDDLAGGGPAVAIEPMTCAPDAFNSGDGLIVLERGGAWTGSWGITPLG
jgi:aldose 1-epimerase